MKYFIKEPRILLINPKQINSIGEFTLPPMGLTLISAVLKKNHFYVKGLNLDYEEKSLYLILEDTIKKYNINIVGVSSLSYGYNESQEIFNIVKKLNKEIITIIGGGIIKEDTELIFDSFTNLDIGVIGEGETTIVELMTKIKNNKDLNSVNGIIFKGDSGSIVTEKRAFIKNLDDLPYPDFDEFNIEKFFDLQYLNSNYQLYKFDKPKLLTLFSSRSCPFGCTFCAHIIGRKYRAFSLDYFFKLLDYVIEKYHINMLHVLDELFSVNKKRLKEFCERIKPYNISWWAQTRVDTITKEDLIMMKEAGCYYVSYGIEHVSEKILKSMKKKITYENIEKILNITYNLKLGIQGNIIIGDPLETEETFFEAVNWVMNNQKYQPNIYPIITYPGTQIFNYAWKNNLIKDKIDFIKSKTMFINLTTMTDDKYFSMVKYASDVSQYISSYGDFISIRFNTFHKILGYMYTLKVNCSHCKEDNTYINYHMNPNLETWNSIKICCRHCNSKFDISKNTIQKNMIDTYKFDTLSSSDSIYMIIDQDENDIISKLSYFFDDFKNIQIKKTIELNQLKEFQGNIEKLIISNIEDTINENSYFILPFLKNNSEINNTLDSLLKHIDKNNIINIDKWTYKYKKR